MDRLLSLAVTAAAGLALIGCSSSTNTEKKAEAPAATPAPETPAPKKVQAPDVYKVNFDTSRGLVVVEVHRDWAPIGADHFYELVQAKYYDGNRFFRVLKGFVVQFGLNGDPAVTAKWANMSLPDDPVTQHNVRGTLVYATAGPATRTTQLFINLGNNSASLDPQGFAPFAKVVEGMDVVDSIYGGYGETPDQGLITSRGNDYLTQHFPKLDYIKTATIVP
ncbi:MAG TPA: peptidylprolyl isomerase [Bryobacteraceae bacterium]|nr:peptidylprolyl isomerase [Bryobacteraceae bacterium]